MKTITKIEPQKNKQDRVNVYINDEFFCGMQNFVCVKYKLVVGMSVEDEYMLKLLMESDYEKALNSAMKLLSKMLKTKQQIFIYLKTKQFDEIVINKVVEKLTEYSYINDENYVNMYVSTYGKKYGKKKIEFELIKKGVDRKLVSDLLVGFKSDENEILEMSKKYLKNKDVDYKNLQKLSAYLQYKGYSWEDISRVISKLKNSQDDE